MTLFTNLRKRKKMCFFTIIICLEGSFVRTTLVLRCSLYDSKALSDWLELEVSSVTQWLAQFGWLANQAYFKELTDVDVRGQMFTEQQNAIEADMAPFGFIDNGLDDPEGRNNSFFDDSGVLWNPVSYHRGEN